MRARAANAEVGADAVRWTHDAGAGAKRRAPGPVALQGAGAVAGELGLATGFAGAEIAGPDRATASGGVVEVVVAPLLLGSIEASVHHPASTGAQAIGAPDPAAQSLGPDLPRRGRTVGRRGRTTLDARGGRQARGRRSGCIVLVIRIETRGANDDLGRGQGARRGR